MPVIYSKYNNNNVDRVKKMVNKLKIKKDKQLRKHKPKTR